MRWATANKKSENLKNILYRENPSRNLEKTKINLLVVLICFFQFNKYIRYNYSTEFPDELESFRVAVNY